MKTIKPTQFYL